MRLILPAFSLFIFEVEVHRRKYLDFYIKIFWYICQLIWVHCALRVSAVQDCLNSGSENQQYVNSVMLGQASCQRCQNILFKVFQRRTGRLCPRSISSTYQTRLPTIPPPRRLLYILFPLCVNDKSKSKCLWIRKKWDRSNRNWSNNFCGTRF